MDFPGYFYTCIKKPPQAEKEIPPEGVIGWQTVWFALSLV